MLTCYFSGGEKTGGERHQAPPGKSDNPEVNYSHYQGSSHHCGNDPGVAVLTPIVNAVESPEEEVLPFLLWRPQDEGTEGRAHGKGVDGAQHRGRGNGQSKLAVELAGNAGEKSSGDENSYQNQSCGNHRAADLTHGLD